jgi:hypothetical protein
MTTLNATADSPSPSPQKSHTQMLLIFAGDGADWVNGGWGQATAAASGLGPGSYGNRTTRA